MRLSVDQAVVSPAILRPAAWRAAT
jgi:hypothetical protein